MCEDFVFSCGGEFFFVNLIFFFGEGGGGELRVERDYKFIFYDYFILFRDL